MVLTTAQLQALKADIAAAGDLSVFPNTSDGNFAIAQLYNLSAVPAFIVWATDVPVRNVYDAITWANLTPNDTPDTTQLWENRALMCQAKQINLQIMLQGQATVNGAKANIRAGLQDALTAIPSGTGGAPRAAGWATGVQPSLQRTATRIEKLLAAGVGTSASPATMTVEGAIGHEDVGAARNS